MNLMDLPNGPGFSPDGGRFWVKDNLLYWQDGEVWDMTEGWIIRAVTWEKGDNYSDPKYRAKHGLPALKPAPCKPLTPKKRPLPVRPCCKEWGKASVCHPDISQNKAGTWSVLSGDTDLPPLKFCPWCGTKAPGIPKRYSGRCRTMLRARRATLR